MPDVLIAPILESIEVDLWLAEAYLLRGAQPLAIVALNEAFKTYLEFAGEFEDSDIVRPLLEKMVRLFASIKVSEGESG